MFQDKTTTELVELKNQLRSEKSILASMGELLDKQIKEVVDHLEKTCDHKYKDGTSSVKSGPIADNEVCHICYKVW